MYVGVSEEVGEEVVNDGVGWIGRGQLGQWSAMALKVILMVSSDWTQ